MKRGFWRWCFGSVPRLSPLAGLEKGKKKKRKNQLISLPILA